MPTLSSNIVKREIASPKDVERALARQAIHGGDLVTNLLEIANLNEDRLTRAIADNLGLEPAPTGELPRSADGLLRLVPSDLARRHGFFPLEERDGTLVVAVGDPIGEEAASDLEFSLGVKLVQRASTLVRVRQAIARDYGVPLDRRFVRVLARLDGKPDPHPSVMPPPFGERKEPTVPPDTGAAEPPRGRGSAAALDLQALAGSSSKTSAERRRIGPYTVAMAEHDLVSADRRDDVVTTFFDFASQYFEYAALFVVHGDLAEGRDAHGSGAPRAKVRGLGVPLDLPSTLSLLISGREPFRLARLAPTGLDGGMVKDLERKPGPLILLLPVRVRERAVLVLYGDHGDQDIGLDAVGDVISFAPLVTAALERVILKRKGVPQRASIPPRSIRPSAPGPGSVPPARSMPPARVLSVEPPAFERPPEHSAPPRPVLSVGPGRRVHTPAPASLAPPMTARMFPDPLPEIPAQAQVPAEPEFPAPPPPVEFDEDASAVIAAATGATPPWTSTKTTMGIAPGMLRAVTAKAPGVDSKAASQAFAAHEHGTKPGVGSDDRDSVPPPPPPPPPADVDRGSDLDWGAAPTASPSSPRPPGLRDETRELIEALSAGDARAADRLVAIGVPAVPALVGALPGPITSELRRGSGDGLPRASNCGPVLKVLARIGPAAASMVAVRASDTDATVRAWTTRLLGELPSQDAAETVALRFLDQDIEVRRAALAAGRMLAANRAARTALSNALSDVLIDPTKPDSVRHMAIEAVADLREARAVPGLIRTLATGSSEIKRSAHWALVVLTRADFGSDPEFWDAWWMENSERHRIEWLIDALVHSEQEIRRAAGDELKSTTKEYFGYYDDLSPRERERAQGRYREWWSAKGQQRFEN